jgi:hypothetical protein
MKAERFELVNGVAGDQVVSVRPSTASPLQALELVNGESYTHRLSRGARRLLGELPPEPASLFNAAFAGRTPKPAAFDVDVSNASTLWLVVEDAGSNAPERLHPAWADTELLIGDAGSVPLASLTPRDPAGLRPGDREPGGGVRVKNPSILVYDIGGKGFTRFRGRILSENAAAEIGSTLNPDLRFFVFDRPPNTDVLVPPAPGTPLPAPTVVTTIDGAIAWVFGYALGRAPSAAERRAAAAALRRADGDPRPSAAGLADLLWAVTMKPEFQFVY